MLLLHLSAIFERGFRGEIRYWVRFRIEVKVLVKLLEKFLPPSVTIPILGSPNGWTMCNMNFSKICLLVASAFSGMQIQYSDHASTTIKNDVGRLESISFAFVSIVAISKQ